ncbi:MAG: hypothetical protein QOI76_229 [Frankiales bacterium]|nr:hypothetical protein [Frankiales bacterium]
MLTDYRRLWLGYSVSTIGDGVTLSAGPLLWRQCGSSPPRGLGEI